MPLFLFCARSYVIRTFFTFTFFTLLIAPASFALAAPLVISRVYLDSTNGAGNHTVYASTSLAATKCALRVDGTGNYAMTRTATNSSVTALFSKSVSLTIGKHTLSVVCQNASADKEISETTILIVDTNTPTITKVYLDDEKNFGSRIVYADVSSNIVTCSLLIDGLGSTGRNGMQSASTASGLVFRKSVYVPTGKHTATVTCQTDAGNKATISHTWTAVDTVPPTISGLAVDSTIAGERTVSVTLEDNSSIETAFCGVAIDGTSVGNATSNDTTKLLKINITSGSHTIKASCFDDAGNVSVSEKVLTFTNPVALPSVTINATGNLYQWNISASAPFCNEDPNVAEKKCTISVDGSLRGVMQEVLSDTGVFSSPITFTSAGSHTVTVKCTNNAGVTAVGTKRITVINQTTPSTAPSLSITAASRSGTDSNPFAITLTTTGGTSDDPLRCGALIDNQDAGEFDFDGSHTYKMHDVEVPAGSHHFTFICYDSQQRYTINEQLWLFSQAPGDTSTDDSSDDAVDATAADEAVKEADTAVSEDVEKDTSDNTASTMPDDSDDNETTNATAVDEVAEDDSSFSDDTADTTDTSNEDEEENEDEVGVGSNAGTPSTHVTQPTSVRTSGSQTTARRTTPTSATNQTTPSSQAAIAAWIGVRISPVTSISTSTDNKPTTTFRAKTTSNPATTQSHTSTFSFITDNKLLFGAIIAAVCTFVLAGVIMLVILKR